MKKRVISMILVLVMLVGMLPVMTQAESLEESGTSAETNDYIYYTDIFYMYPQYLASDAYYNDYASSTEGLFDAVHTAYQESALKIGTGVGYALDNITKPIDIATLITDTLGLTDYSYNQALDDANDEFVQNILTESSVYNVSKAYGKTSKIIGKFNEVITSFNELELSSSSNQIDYTTEYYVQQLFDKLHDKGFFSYISDNVVAEIWTELNDEDFKLSNYFTAAKSTFDQAKAITLVMAMEDMRIDIVDEIIATQTEDTVLKQGMQRLKSKLIGGYAHAIVHNYIIPKLADKLCDKINTLIVDHIYPSDVVAFLKVAKEAFHALFDVPSVAQVLKWQVLMCYSRDLGIAIHNKAQSFSEGTFLSDEILTYEHLFMAYDSTNQAAMNAATGIANMMDPYGGAYGVLEEAVQKGIDTITVTSGKVTLHLDTSMTKDYLRETLMAGTIVTATGESYVLEKEITLSNGITTITLAVKGNLVASLMFSVVSDYQQLITNHSITYNGVNLFQQHIENIKKQLYAVSKYERETAAKQHYKNLTYEFEENTQIRYQSDTIEPGCYYLVDDMLRGNVLVSSEYTIPSKYCIGIDGNVTLGCWDSLIIPKNASLTVTGNVNVNAWAYADDYRSTLISNGYLEINGALQGYGLLKGSGTYVLNKIAPADTAKITLENANFTLKGNNSTAVAANGAHIVVLSKDVQSVALTGTTATLDVQSTQLWLTSSDLTISEYVDFHGKNVSLSGAININPGAIAKEGSNYCSLYFKEQYTLTNNIYADYMEFAAGLLVKEGDHTLRGRAFFHWGEDFIVVSKGATLNMVGSMQGCQWAWQPINTTINNHGTVTIDGTLYSYWTLSGDGVYRIGKVPGNDVNIQGATFHFTDHIEGTINITENVTGINLCGTSGQSVGFNGNISVLTIDNPVNVTFKTAIRVTKLFNHKQNPFTLYNNGSGSSFVDYDKDGLLDHKDPDPVNHRLKLTVKTLPTKTSYTLGEPLCLDGGILEISYPDGTYKEISLSGLDASYDTRKIGFVTVTLTYDGAKTTFEIIVRPPQSDELTGHSFHGEGLFLTEIYSNDVERNKATDTREKNAQLPVSTYDTDADLMEFVELISTHKEDFQFNEIYALYYDNKELPVVTLDGSSNITVKNGQPIVIWNERVDVTNSAIPDAETFRKEMHIPDSALILKTPCGYGWSPTATFVLKLRSTGEVFCTFATTADVDVKDGMSVELKMPSWQSSTTMEPHIQKALPSPGFVYADQLSGDITITLPESQSPSVFITEIRPHDGSREEAYGTTSDYMECLEIVNNTSEPVILNEDLLLLYTYKEGHRKPFFVYQYSTDTENHIGTSSDCIIPAGSAAVIWIYRYEYLKANSSQFPTLADFRNAYSIPANVPVYLVTNQDGLNNTDRGFELYTLNEDGTLDMPVSSYFYNGITDLVKSTSVQLQTRHNGPGMAVYAACAPSTMGTFLEEQVQDRTTQSVTVTLAEGYVIPESVSEADPVHIVFDCHSDGQLPQTTMNAYYRLDEQGTWTLCSSVTSTGQLEMFIAAGVLNEHHSLEFYVTDGNTVSKGIYWVEITEYVPPITPTLTLKAPALEFKDMIKVVAFYTAENLDDVVEMGMLTYTQKVDVIDINTAAYVIPGAEYEESSGRYFSSSQGIHAKYLGDTVYLACYAKLTDGSYVYTKLAGYGPLDYATNQLKKSTDMSLKQLCAAMLNYGAAAQNYFLYNTDLPANSTLTSEQIQLPEAYNADMVGSVPAADITKQGIFANNKGFSSRKPAVSFEGAFSINYFFTPAYTPVDGVTLYYWNEADFNGAFVMTPANASGAIAMKQEAGQYRCDIEGIAAKSLGEAIYVAAIYSDGTTTWTSGVLGYSIGAYCSSQVSKGGTMAELAMATAVYGYQAKQYFGATATETDLKSALHYLNGKTEQITSKVNSIVFGSIEDHMDVALQNKGTLITVEQDIPVYAYYVPNGANYDVYVLSNDTLYAPTDCSNLCNGMSNLVSFNAANLDFSRTTSMYRMFRDCANLSAIDVSQWDTGNVTNMRDLFRGCNSLTELDVTNWKTGKVETMVAMFQDCALITQLDLNNWDVSNVKQANQMFNRCSKLETLKISQWNPKNLSDGTTMFQKCLALKELDLSNWDTSSLTIAAGMFNHCESITALNVSTWDMSKVTDCRLMFQSCYKLEDLDVSNWDLSNVVDMNCMFYYCKALKEINGIEQWNTGKVTNMQSLFSYCSSLETLDLSQWDVSKVTDFTAMFQKAENLKHLDLSGWNPVSAKTINHMFYGCEQLTELDLGGWNMPALTTTSHMFAYCSKLEAIDISGWCTPNLTSMDGMFNGCQALKTVDVSSLDTSNVREFSQIFENSRSLERIIGLENWNTENGQDFSELFFGCTSLKELDLSGFNTGNADYTYLEADQSENWMFYSFLRNCTSLEKITFGQNFSFDGIGNCPDKYKFVMPSATNVEGWDGKWYDIQTGIGYLPEEIPENTAATYVAVKPENS